MSRNSSLSELHSFGHSSNKSIKVSAQTKEGENVELSFTRNAAIGNGSFGVVYQAYIEKTGENVAIKKVLQDKRFKNRELQIMRLVDHPNLVELKYYFYTNGTKKDAVYLNLILEHMTETIYRTSRNYIRNEQFMPMFYIKLYTYQIFRSIAYIHSLGICHRDIKPQNLLVNPDSGLLKLCDFGSAKVLTKGEPNVAYICSRYYRAPELVFGATYYTTKIDVWSIGCVMAELILGRPLFPGETGVDQLIEIIKVLGTPTKEQIHKMNPNYVEHRFPKISPKPVSKIFTYKVPQEALDLLEKILVYEPDTRISAIEAMAHPFFDELRQPTTRMPNGNILPNLFSFSAIELSPQPELFEKLVPEHCMQQQLDILGISSFSEFNAIPEKERKVPSLG